MAGLQDLQAASLIEFVPPSISTRQSRQNQENEIETIIEKYLRKKGFEVDLKRQQQIQDENELEKLKEENEHLKMLNKSKEENELKKLKEENEKLKQKLSIAVNEKEKLFEYLTQNTLSCSKLIREHILDCNVALYNQQNEERHAFDLSKFTPLLFKFIHYFEQQ